MASIGDVVEELEEAKKSLAEAKTASEGASKHTEDLRARAEGMDLHGMAGALSSLNTRIEATTRRIVEIDGEVDNVIAMARKLAKGNGSGQLLTKPARRWPWRPGKSVRPSPGASLSKKTREEEKRLKIFPKWKENVLSKRTATMTVVVTGGISTELAFISHVPLAVTVGVANITMITGIWKAHLESSEKDKPEE